MSMTLYPAIDVRNDCVVRLRQGDYARETRYADAPLAVAQRYFAQGAQWVHLVDLDAARNGGYSLQPLLRAIRQSTTLRVQTGGGVRCERDVQALIDAGADRVVVGSLAVEEPERVCGWLQRFGAECITIALDARRDDRGEWRVPSRGWTVEGSVPLQVLLRTFASAGLRHLLCTDIARDGMLSGPNTELYRDILNSFPSVELQASGGIRDSNDVLAVRDVKCSGAVLGKALLDGRFVLDEALAAVGAC